MDLFFFWCQKQWKWKWGCRQRAALTEPLLCVISLSSETPVVDGRPHRCTEDHVSCVYDTAAALISPLHWPIYGSHFWTRCFPERFHHPPPLPPPSSPALDLTSNPVPFAIDVHLSIFACVWGLFWKDLGHRARRGNVWKEKWASPLVAAVARSDTSEEMENWTHTHPIYH